MQHKNRLAVDLAEKQKSTIAQRCDSGELDACKSRPMRCSRTDLDSEPARATKQGADTYCAASTAIAELIRLGVDAMKAQKQSQGSKPVVCGVGIPILDRHNVLTQPFAATGRV
jgi:hypothetical protein